MKRVYDSMNHLSKYKYVSFFLTIFSSLAVIGFGIYKYCQYHTGSFIFLIFIYFIIIFTTQLILKCSRKLLLIVLNKYNKVELIPLTLSAVYALLLIILKVATNAVSRTGINHFDFAFFFIAGCMVSCFYAYIFLKSLRYTKIV
jgi:hypothetical protein